MEFNPLKAELNPICHLPALLGAHHIFHVSGLTVKPNVPEVWKYVLFFKSMSRVKAKLLLVANS